MTNYEFLSRYTVHLLYDNKFDIFKILGSVLKDDLPRECFIKFVRYELYDYFRKEGLIYNG